MHIWINDVEMQQPKNVSTIVMATQPISNNSYPGKQYLKIII